MGEADDPSSTKEAVRIGSATTTRTSPEVILIDDGTLDTVFCPADGLSIASTLDDVFCSDPMDDSVIDTPKQRRRKQNGEIRSTKQRVRHSPEKKETNRVASPRTPSRHPAKDLSKHRRSEIKSSPRYLSASKSRTEDAGMHAEGSKRTSKRRGSDSQVEGVKQQHKELLVNNSKRTRSLPRAPEIENLELGDERAISSHRCGSSNPRTGDPKQQKKTGDIEIVDRISRMRSLARAVDPSGSAHKRRCAAFLAGKGSDKGVTPQRSKMSPQRSSSASRIESIDRQERMLLNKRSSSDSRIVQVEQNETTEQTEHSVRTRSPQRSYSKSRIQELESEIERSRSSHKRRNSNPQVEKAKEQLSEETIENSKRTVRSLPRSNSKTRIESLEKRIERSRSSHRRGNSTSGMRDSNPHTKNDDIEKSERTRSSHRTNSNHGRPTSKTRIGQSKNLKNKEEVGNSERQSITQDVSEESKHCIEKHKRRGSKSRIVLPNETEKVEHSERTISSHKRGSSMSSSWKSEQQESKVAIQSFVNSKSGPAVDRRTEKGYLIKPSWRKISEVVVSDSTDEKRSPTKRSDHIKVSDVCIQNKSRIRRRSLQNCDAKPTGDINEGKAAKSLTKRNSPRPMLHSNFQPHARGDRSTENAPLRHQQKELVVTREHFSTALIASEAAIIPRKEEKVALLQSTETIEKRIPGSPRERMKSLSPTKFIKKASQRFTNAVAQLSGRVLQVGASDVISREQKYSEPLAATEIKGSLQELVSKESTSRSEKPDWNPQSRLSRDTKKRGPKMNPVSPTLSETVFEDIERCPSPRRRRVSHPRPRSKSANRLQSENNRTISPIRRTTPRQNSQRTLAHIFRSSSLRHLGSPSSPDKASETVSPHGVSRRQHSQIELGSQSDFVVTPSTKYSFDSPVRPVACSPRHRRRLASSLLTTAKASRQSPLASPISDTDHVLRTLAGMTVQVLLSAALLPPETSNWSSSLLFKVFLLNENQWICLEERDLHNNFTETLFSFELGCEQTLKLSNSLIEVRIYDGFNFRGCLHLPTEKSYGATWLDVRPTSLDKKCTYPNAKGQVQVTVDFQVQTMPIFETGFVLQLPQALEFHVESGGIHCVAVDRERGITFRDGSCVYHDSASQNNALQRRESGLQLTLSKVPMSVGAMFLIVTDSSGKAGHCVVRHPANQVGICSIKTVAMKTTILARISRNPNETWELTGICQSFSEVPNLGLLFPVLQYFCLDVMASDTDAATCPCEAWMIPGETIRLQDYCSDTSSLRVEVHSKDQVTAILSDYHGRKIDSICTHQPQSRDGQSVSLHPNVRNAFSLDLSNLSSQVHVVGFVAHATNIPSSSSSSPLNFRFVVRNRQTVVVQYLSQENHAAQDSLTNVTDESPSVWLGCFYRDPSQNGWNFWSLGTRTHVGHNVAALSFDLHKKFPPSNPSSVPISLEANPLGDLVYLDRRE